MLHKDLVKLIKVRIFLFYKSILIRDKYLDYLIEYFCILFFIKIILLFKFILYLKLNNLFQFYWLIISIANKDEVVTVAVKENLIS